MKKSLIYSLLLHITLISLALLLSHGEKKKGEDPYFYTDIISPNEIENDYLPKVPLKQKNIISPKGLTQKPKDNENRHGQKIITQDRTRGISADNEKIDDKEGLIQDNKLIRTEHDKGQNGTVSGQLNQKPQLGDAISEANKGKESIFPTPGKSLREKLFDSNVITQYALKEKTKDRDMTFDTKEFKYYGYMNRLKEKIEGIWKYPPDAAQKGIYGDLYIRFTINKNGDLGAIELLRTSGYKSLDDAAIRALKEAAPYWPLPDEWGKDGLTITGHFIYTLYGTYIK